MANPAIRADVRKQQGKGAARTIREEGMVPAVVYGSGQTATLLEVNAKEVLRIIEHGGEGRLVNLEVNGNKQAVILKEVQRNAINGRLLHVDFHSVRLDKQVHTVVPITLVGEHSRTIADRVLIHGTRELELACLPTNIPEHIEVDVANLQIGESIKAADLALPEGVSLVSDPETMIVAATQSRAGVESEQATAEVEAEG